MAYGVELSCYACNQFKPEQDFYLEPKNTGRNGRYSACIPCTLKRGEKYRNENRLKIRKRDVISKRKKKTNFTEELFNETLESQGNVCAICGTKEPGGRGQFHADHNHKTFKPRGVLCHKCNVGLGHFNDSPELLQAAIDYLMKYLEVK